MNNFYATSNFHLDAVDTIFFQNQLEYLKKEIYKEDKVLKKASILIPTSYDTPAGAKVVAYRTMEGSQNGKLVANYATDFPTVSISGKAYSSPIATYGNSFLVTVQDIREARLASIDLDTELAVEAMESHLNWMNKLAFLGDAVAGIPGWLTNTDIPKTPVAGSNTEQKTWAYKAVNNPAAIVADIMECMGAPTLATDGNANVDTLVMPLDQYLLIQSLRLGNTSDTTVLEFVTENSKAFNPTGVNIDWAPELKGAFAGADGMIAYRKNIRDFWQEVPLEPTLYPPQLENLTFKNIIESRHGGTIVVRTKHQAIRTGI